MSDQDAKPFSEALRATLLDTRLLVRTAGCPDESLWYKLAGGETADIEGEQLLDHAAYCGYCAALLREAIEDLQTGTTPEESDILNGLKVVTVPVTLDLPASRLSSHIPASMAKLPRRRVHTPIWRWAVAAGLVLACAVGVLKYEFPSWALGHAESLLAKGEMRGRMSEFRLSGAPYAPFHLNRSGAQPVPAELVSALDWANRAGDQPRAGVLRARIRIAGGAPEDATGALDNAARTMGADASLSNDLAVSWALRAAEYHDPADAARALAAVDKALASKPSFAPALYNRALILQLLVRNNDACQALSAFLDVEMDPRWREEATARIMCPGR